MKTFSYIEFVTPFVIMSFLVTLMPVRIAVGEEMASTPDTENPAPETEETSTQDATEETAQPEEDGSGDSVSTPAEGSDTEETHTDELIPSIEATSSAPSSEDTTTATSEPPEDEQTAITATSTGLSSEEETAETGTATSSETDHGSSSPEMPSLTSTGTTSSSSTHIGTHATTTDATTTTSTSTGTHTETGTTTGDVTIQTGTSVALANILNLVNSNFINSDGVVLFKNFFETLLTDFDLRILFNSLASYGCSVTSCSSDEVHTSIQNGAVIDNELYVEAISGGNSIDGSSNAAIDTGDAYAGINLVNIANTNVVDSNYLLLTFNAFQDVNGDIVFPSLSTFFNNLTQGSSPESLDIVNTANVNNNVTLDAQSGSNTIDGASSSTIRTGASTAGTNVFNQLSTSLIGGQSISIIFRVHGSWAGEIFGAPDDLAWMENGDGGIYLFDKSGSGGAGDNLHIAATNTATINNNVHAVALTGENAISGSETALISTGNAYAGVNIMNIANATVVGRNWILAIINILGDFNGNIAFGRPDLWIGGQASVPGNIENGSELKYTLTIINNGDSVASDVVLADEYDTEYLEIYDASVPYTVDGAGRLVWLLPDLEPGEATEITYFGRVQNAGFSTDITNMLTVEGHETDNNISDNTDIVTVTTKSRSRGGGSRVRLSPADAALTSGMHTERPVVVERISLATNVHINNEHSATQKLILENTTDRTLSNVIFYDILKNPAGKVLHEEVWDLGDVQPFEHIEVAYDVSFGSRAPRGLYMLDTKVEQNGSIFIDENNGSILVWESVAPTPEFLTMTSTVRTTVSEPESYEPTFIETIFPKVALASEQPDIQDARDIGLSRAFAIAGMLLMLTGLLGLYQWFRPERVRIISRK